MLPNQEIVTDDLVKLEKSGSTQKMHRENVSQVSFSRSLAHNPIEHNIRISKKSYNPTAFLSFFKGENAPNPPAGPPSRAPSF